MHVYIYIYINVCMCKYKHMRYISIYMYMHIYIYITHDIIHICSSSAHLAFPWKFLLRAAPQQQEKILKWTKMNWVSKYASHANTKTYTERKAQNLICGGFGTLMYLKWLNYWLWIGYQVPFIRSICWGILPMFLRCPTISPEYSHKNRWLWCILVYIYIP